MNILKARLILFCSILLLAQLVFGKDLGELGEVFPIAERDLLEVIQNKLQAMERSGELAVHQKYIQNKVKARVLTPVANNLPEAVKREVHYYDPSIIVAEDLTDGQGNIFKHKGEKINPLASFSFKEPWVFFDANSKKQTQFALKIASLKQAKLIMTAGRPLALMEKTKVPVYFDQGGYLIRKFNIKHVPATVRQDGLRLKIIEHKLKQWKK